MYSWRLKRDPPSKYGLWGCGKRALGGVFVCWKNCGTREEKKTRIAADENRRRSEAQGSV